MGSKERRKIPRHKTGAPLLDPALAKYESKLIKPKNFHFPWRKIIKFITNPSFIVILIVIVPAFYYLYINYFPIPCRTIDIKGSTNDPYFQVINKKYFTTCINKKWVFRSYWPNNEGDPIAAFPSQEVMDKANKMVANNTQFGSKFHRIRYIHGTIKKINPDQQYWYLPKEERKKVDAKITGSDHFVSVIKKKVHDSARQLCWREESGYDIMIRCWIQSKDKTFYNYTLETNTKHFLNDYRTFFQIMAKTKYYK